MNMQGGEAAGRQRECQPSFQVLIGMSATELHLFKQCVLGSLPCVAPLAYARDAC